MAGMSKSGLLFTVLLALALVCPAFRAKAAGYDALLPLLVDLPGWEAEAADGADASAQGMGLSRCAAPTKAGTAGSRSTC